MVTPIVRQTRFALAPVLAATLLMAGCTPNATGETTTTEVHSTTAPSTTSTIQEGLGECTPELLNPPDSALDVEIDGIAARYNLDNAGGIVDSLGEGAVYDPMLDPLDGVEVYPTIEEWVEAGSAVNDHFAMYGYTAGSEPVAFHASRSSDVLASAGIELTGVSVFAYQQECEYRIVVGPQVTSGDNACSVYAAFGPEADADAPDECSADASSVGRTSHVAVWTGEEMIIWGGTRSSLTNSSLTTGVAYNPSSGSWRRIADLTIEEGNTLEYGSIAAWTGSEMLVVGPTLGGQLVGAAYDPMADTWRAMAPIPSAERNYVGGWVWTGEELLLWGGDQNYMFGDGWSYNPSTDAWEELPPSPKPPTEAPQAAWTGSEKIIWGGYPYEDSYGVAFDPSTRTWRIIGTEPQIYDFPMQAVEDHALTWTENELLLWGGHGGPGHTSSLFGYRPGSDRWRSLEPAPIEGRERYPAVWTGNELVIWGGFATYGPIDNLESLALGDGAVYDPDSDRWNEMSPSPLGDRCDHTGVWTGTVVIYFGGYEQCGNLDAFTYGTAASYDPTADTWELLPPPPS